MTFTPPVNDFDECNSYDSVDFALSVSSESKITVGNDITNKDTHKIFQLKVAALIILLTSASCLAAGAYVYISRSETNDFKAKFGYESSKVFQEIGGSLDRTLGLLDSISVTFVSYAKDKGDIWPFVTLPDFGVRMAKLLPQTDAFNIAVLPIVTPKNRLEWEKYSIQNDQWVNQSITIQESWDGYHGPISYNWEPYDKIYSDIADIEANVSRNMLPQWQSFPAIPEIVFPYNWDWGSESNPDAVQNTISTQKCIFSETYMIPNPNNPEAQAESEGWIEWHTALIHPNEIAFEPVLDVFYPIINDVTKVDVSNSTYQNTSDNSVVGIIAISIYWREFIRNILPPGSKGIVVVVQCPCNPTFTYQVNGPDVKYLGIGDNHEQKYDHMVLESTLVDLHVFTSRTGIYSGAPINSVFCPYTLRVYPSAEMKSDYTTTTATIAMVMVILIFAFVSFIFVVYDCSVERRQDKVMTKAIRSSAIVDELFPSYVRNQLYFIKGRNKKGRKQPKGEIDEINDVSIGPYNGEQTEDQFGIQGSMAQVYPETTVIFADIVGFTSWSATREPTQVFHLLETLYAGFDALAKVYGVYKIETIGDSYVAVVGLPRPRKYHAVVMAKFANDCRNKMTELTQGLEEVLGEGTSNLLLRIGLNSGPTTAGVLRGEKARFQLFGDTVNTASRMESNGEPNKIHISETTAELIRLAGKGDWLVRRDEKITAKGKGLMQTYWCEPVVVTATTLLTTTKTNARASL